MLVLQRCEEFSALAGEGAQLVHELPNALRIQVPLGRSVGPLKPQAICGKEAGCVLGPEGGIEVKQRAKSKALVVVEVRSQQVVISPGRAGSHEESL